VRFDFPVSGLEEMSRDELIVVVRQQAGQITAMVGQLSTTRCMSRWPSPSMSR
jgi:hypothetical protein